MFNQLCRAVGAAAIAPPDGAGGQQGNASSIANIGGTATGTMRPPRTGSFDLALGVGVGLCLGGAAVFVVLMTRFRRQAARWPRRQGEGARGFGYDGVRLHGGGGGGGSAAAAGEGGARWPRRRSGPPTRHGRRGGGGKGKAAAGGRGGPKEVALELGRVGFDYDGREGSEFAALTLLQDSDSGQGRDRDDVVRDREVSGLRRGGGDGVLVDASPRSASGVGVHRRSDSRGQQRGAAAGGRVGLSSSSSPLSPLRTEVTLGDRVQDDPGEHDTLLGGGGGC